MYVHTKAPHQAKGILECKWLAFNIIDVKKLCFELNLTENITRESALEKYLLESHTL